jgi:hypothetical protein
MFLLGVAIGFVALAGGCDGSSQEGTKAAFSPEADKARQDAMRENMMKNMAGPSGQGAKAKK